MAGSQTHQFTRFLGFGKVRDRQPVGDNSSVVGILVRNGTDVLQNFVGFNYFEKPEALVPSRAGLSSEGDPLSCSSTGSARKSWSSTMRPSSSLMGRVRNSLGTRIALQVPTRLYHLQHRIATKIVTATVEKTRQK